jgi:hypothetical protein
MIYIISHSTGITDISSIESSEMLPLEYELLSGDSTVLNSNLTRCIALCSIQKSCSVASFKALSNKTIEEDNEHHGPNGSIGPVGMCNHYMYSPFGLWKSKKITDDGQCFAKLQNIGMLTFRNKVFFQQYSYFFHTLMRHKYKSIASCKIQV